VDAGKDYTKEAIAIAEKSDVIIFCGGISSNLEGEEMSIEIDGFSHGDRTDIQLPKIQEDLLKELFKTGKPIIYVNFSGSAIALNWENENLPAIVQGFYPGEATGTALARLLFGDFNPSGRLPITFYKSIDQLPDFKNYDMAGRTYRYFNGEVLYPFGHGLSYSNFNYSNLQTIETADSKEPISVSVVVKNNGNFDGEEVVQVYVSNKTSKVIVPNVSLKAFQRVFLKKGSQKTVTIMLKHDDFSVPNEDFKPILESGKFEIRVGGSLSGKNVLTETISISDKYIDIKKQNP
jgi:beta-glucosidase